MAFRIDTSTAVGVRPTPGPAGTTGYFSNGNPATGVPATVVDQDFLNGIQEELMSVLQAANITPVKGALAQLWQAILSCHLLADIGAVNAYVANPSPAITALVPGMRVDLNPGNTNTAASTFNVSGLGAISVVRPDNSPLQPGDVTQGQLVSLIYAPSGNVWRLVSWPARIRLTGALALYVNSATGSDSNNGLSSGAPFATMNKAYNWLQQSVDTGGNIVTVNCVGTTLSPLSASGFVLGAVAASSIIFLGNTGSPSAVQVNASNAHAFNVSQGAAITVKGFQISASGSSGGASSCGLVASQNSTIVFNNMIFSTCAGWHLWSTGSSQIFCGPTPVYTVSGSALAHLFAQSLALIQVQSAQVTLSGTPAFASGYAIAADMGLIAALSYAIVSGTATGPRYTATGNSVIDTAGGGASFFPGNSGGTTATGAQYI